MTDVVLDSFFYRDTRQWNIVATVDGTIPSEGEVVIGAHYDSQSTISTQAPGADDNASGTAAIIEMARALKRSGFRPRFTTRFIAFGAEEMGLIGSNALAARAKADRTKIIHMQNYDMIGHRNQSSSDRDVLIVWYPGSEDLALMDSTVKRLYTTLMPVLTTSYRQNSDSWPYASVGYRAVFNIERDFSPYYHTPRDSSIYLDFDYATEIVKSGLALLLATDQRAGTTAVDIIETPSTLTLEQNYPNPFNGETVIEYRISVDSRPAFSVSPAGRPSTVDGRLRLSIFDLLGREVAVLVEGDLSPGEHVALWNAAGMPSGVYFSRLNAGNVLLTRKMLLAR